MTKKQEIAILRSAVELLGDNSYCGPWLASVVDEVESTIRSDYFPTVTMAESRKACGDIIAAANREAQAIVEAATIKAKHIEDRAQRYQDCVAEALRLALRNLNCV